MVAMLFKYMNLRGIQGYGGSAGPLGRPTDCGVMGIAVAKTPQLDHPRRHHQIMMRSSSKTMSTLSSACTCSMVSRVEESLSSLSLAK